MAFTVALGYGIAAPAIPQFARQFGVSTAAAASVISAFALVRVAGALPAGRLVNRLGERAVMVAGIAVVAASSVLAGLSASPAPSRSRSVSRSVRRGAEAPLQQFLAASRVIGQRLRLVKRW